MTSLSRFPIISSSLNPVHRCFYNINTSKNLRPHCTMELRKVWTDYNYGGFGAKSMSRELVVESIKYENCYGQVERPKYDCLLFDLDDTLYPASSGLATACCHNIEVFMVDKLGIDRSIISELGDLLYKNYGTTMAGLKAIGYDFQYDEYYSFVHGRLPYENLKPDLVLRSLLLSLPIRKIIFTNADRVHALKVLSRLALEDCFEDIICFETLNPINDSSVSDVEDDIQFDSGFYSSTTTGSDEIFDIIRHFSQPNSSAAFLPKTPIVCKPSKHAIEKALKICNCNPRRTLFIEDSVRSLKSGKLIGLDTALVGTSMTTKRVDYSLQSIHSIRDALPELWFAVKKS